MTDWYQDWQHPAHAEAFDRRAHLDDRNFIRSYECFNDVRLLGERVDRRRPLTLVEVGCATGDLYRYLALQFPQITYYGVDISEGAIDRARRKYPDGRFVVARAGEPLHVTLARAGLRAKPDLVYAKDVVHHQAKPFEFLAELLDMASQAVILRLRTRDVGATELDPERSCQYHYGGWMPYIVLNLQELIDHLRAEAPGSRVVVYRHHMVLGGHNNRFVPKALYLEETGTAETAVGLFKRTDRPGEVIIQDRPDEAFTATWEYRVKRLVRKALQWA